jgi:hypothetical protein
VKRATEVPEDSANSTTQRWLFGSEIAPDPSTMSKIFSLLEVHLFKKAGHQIATGTDVPQSFGSSRRITFRRAWYLWNSKWAAVSQSHSVS